MALTSPERARNSGFALPRLLKWTGIAFGVLVLLVVALSFWLLRTESGLQFALARAIGATDGKLTIGTSSGTLAGPVTLDKLRYRDAAAGIDVRARHAIIAFVPLELLSSRLHLTHLQLDGLDVALSSVPAPPESKPSGEFPLAAPLDVVLDRLTLMQAKFSSDAQPLFAIDTLDVIGRWTHDGIALTSLALHSPDGSADLHGTVSALAGYPGSGELTFHWKVAGTEYAGTLNASGNGKQARLDLALTGPTPARVIATLTQSRDLPWTATLRLPRFDPRRVRKDSALSALALTLEASGDKARGALSGEVDLDDHRVQLDTLRYALNGRLLKIEALTLRSPQAAGSLNANGEVQLDAEPPSAKLALDWQGVELPADLVGQPLATHGKLDASGSTQKF
ncbi:MAG: pathogenicity protein, partial [Lysobacterales bacterium]